MAAGALKILAAAFAYNEGEKIHRALSRHPASRDYDLLVMDDGSTDGSLSHLPADGILVLRNPRNLGIGAAMKQVFQYALDHHYDVLVIQAGNDKDDPAEIPRLLEPIRSGLADFVQGSRFLPGGGYGNTPAYRVLAARTREWVETELRGLGATPDFLVARPGVAPDDAPPECAGCPAVE